MLLGVWALNFLHCGSSGEERASAAEKGRGVAMDCIKNEAWRRAGVWGEGVEVAFKERQDTKCANTAAVQLGNGILLKSDCRETFT